MGCFAAESSAGLQAAQQQRAAAALAQRLQAACVTIASHEMAAAEFKRYFQELQDRNAQLGALAHSILDHGDQQFIPAMAAAMCHQADLCSQQLRVYSVP